MPRQQKTNNVTTTIGTTTFVNKVSTYKLSGSTRTLESEEDIEYDSLGNITKYGNVTYKYDLCGRLVREDNPTIDKTIVWTYNDGSNITQRKEYAYTTSATLDVPTKIFALDYDGGWRDQVTAIEKQPVEYDYAGNPTRYRGMKLNWTRGRLLLCVEKSSGDYASLYDGNGIRKAQEIWLSNGKFWQHAYHYADGHLVAETRRLGAEVKHKIHYFYNQQGVIGMEYDGTHYLYRKNFFGDITAIYNTSGTCVAKYAYDAYGVCKVMNPDGTENTDSDFIGNMNPIRYRGYYYDVETGLYYLQSRYYDPQIGRFISAGDVEHLNTLPAGEPNLYAYCMCNPIARKVSEAVNLGRGEPTVFEEPSTPTGRHNRAVGNATVLPNINHASRSSYSTTVIDSYVWGSLIGNITTTTTVQLHDPTSGFYTISDFGNDSISSGIGFSPCDWFSVEYTASSSAILMKTVQIGKLSVSGGIGINGVNVGIGFTEGNTTTTVTANIGLIPLVVFAVASEAVAVASLVATVAKAIKALILLGV